MSKDLQVILKSKDVKKFSNNENIVPEQISNKIIKIFKINLNHIHLFIQCYTAIKTKPNFFKANMY